MHVIGSLCLCGYIFMCAEQVLVRCRISISQTEFSRAVRSIPGEGGIPCSGLYR